MQLRQKFTFKALGIGIVLYIGFSIFTSVLAVILFRMMDAFPGLRFAKLINIATVDFSYVFVIHKLLNFAAAAFCGYIVGRMTKSRELLHTVILSVTSVVVSLILLTYSHTIFTWITVVSPAPAIVTLVHSWLRTPRTL